MATVTPTFSNDVGARDGSVVQWVWNITTANADGAPLEWVEWADRTVQVVNANWGGATLAIEGSNDGTNWATLSNAAGGTAATFTANGVKTILELTRYMRPNLTVVGVASVPVVTLIARRATPLRT